MSILCIDCDKINLPDDHKTGVCASCSNTRYFAKVSRGEIVVLKVDMIKVRQSTLLQIRAMIAKDIEDYDKGETNEDTHRKGTDLG
jgi:hypothetical protein